MKTCISCNNVTVEDPGSNERILCEDCNMRVCDICDHRFRPDEEICPDCYPTSNGKWRKGF